MRRRTRPARRHARSEAPAPPPPVDAERLAGYRLIRRIATGTRAQIYLAVAARFEDASIPVADRAPSLVVVRVYEVDADQSSIAIELDAMAGVPAFAAALDLTTLDDGRTALVVERLGPTSLAARIADRTLSPGEAVTVLAPLAVAIGDLERHGFALERMTAADVWFDATGRPRLLGAGHLRRLPDAPGSTTERTAWVRATHAALGALIEEVAPAVRPAGALDPVRGLIAERVAERPFSAFHQEIERMLFAVADPAPVAGIEAGTAIPPIVSGRVPTRAIRPMAMAETGRVAARSSEIGSPAGDAVIEPPTDSARAGLRSDLRQAFRRFGIDEVAAVAEGDSIDLDAPNPGWRERLGGFARRRRSTLVVAALAGGAALVMLLTLVPPADGAADAGSTARAVTGGEAAHTAEATTGPVGMVGDTNAPATSEEAEAVQAAPPDATTGEPATSPRPAGATETDALVAVGDLLDRRAECLEQLDLACLDGVVQAGSALEAADRAAILAARSGERAIEPAPLDAASAAVAGEMGAARLVTVPYAGAQREPASILMMRSEAGWRLREIFD
ncbi:hypothetical protein GE115_00505 [Agromyces sp. CFH 90414]|uniref:Protein kinase domain-containing protein n=1 Tax=Agromyces agglutinans TaxID=2662258 RepID=A0A6I2F2I1_9MICO|nr:hypothetical protein [Agromyces agglutinans]MRG58361.1 hypothetical protein [Agromyces agglutinans]